MRLPSPSLLASCATAALIAGAAHAQTAAPPAQPDQVYIEAQTLARTGQDLLTATGEATAHYQDRTLRADTVIYDLPKGVLSAQGGVRITQSDGTAEFADKLTFDDKLQTGVATGFSAVLPHNGHLAADRLVRRSAEVSELNRVIFTPCEICAPDGSSIEPSWSVSAEQVLQDKAKGTIRYRNAVIRIKGVPVLFLPAFSQTDPSIQSKSGLLQPSFSHTARRGLTVEAPYLWDIAPDQDLVISPQFNTRVAPFVNLKYRKRFYSGDVVARFGFTQEQDFNAQGEKFGDERDKSYVLAVGDFRQDNWSWGFTAEGARDRRLFDQYSIEKIYDLGGLFRNDDRRLISQAYAVHQDLQSYLSVAAMGFQSLRPLPLGAPTNAFGVRPLEDDRTLPLVAPLIEYRYEPTQTLIGGRLRLNLTSAVVTRDASPVYVGAPGIDSGRVTIEGDWRRTFTLPAGVRLAPYADLRGDAYRTSDLTPLDLSTHFVTRGIATLGLDATYPFIRQGPKATTIIEPMIQLALSPKTRINPNIPDQDGAAFDFDVTNLFEFNKFPGYDLYEGGARMNVGVTTSVDWGDARNLRAVFGRSFRTQDDPVFPTRTGLSGHSSDWVAGAEIQPMQALSFYARARFDSNDFEINKIEAGANARLGRIDGYVRYLRQDQDVTGTPRQDVEGAGEAFLTKHWGISVDAVRDIEQNTWRRRAGGFVYRDDCLRFEVLYRNEENPVLGLKSSSAFIVRLTLATLGDTR